MTLIKLTPQTSHGERIIARHGDEWLVIEDRRKYQVITDLDEKHQMRVPNAHFTIEHLEVEA